MSVLTLRLPDDKHARLRRLAETRGISMNRLADEWATIALTQFDAETRFRSLAAVGRLPVVWRSSISSMPRRRLQCPASVGVRH